MDETSALRLVPGAGAGTERRRTGTTSGSKEGMAKELGPKSKGSAGNRLTGFECSA